MKSKRTKACDISPKVKKTVWERDLHCCCVCGSTKASPNAHYIPRSQNGKGIEQNIVTLCDKCHYRLDQTTERKKLLEIVKEYLEAKYPDFTDEQRVYRKGEQ